MSQMEDFELFSTKSLYSQLKRIIKQNYLQIYLFEMSEEVTKIDVKDAAIFIDHDIIRITIPDTKDKGGDAVASA